MRRRLTLVVAAAVAAAVAATAALAGSTASSPGVTKKSIALGGTFPLSGPASFYAPIPVGMKAYFDYVNATQHGINGRKISWTYLDDGYNPAQTVQQTRQLVDQNHVFALVGGLGTEPQLAVEQYLNQNSVPQLFVSTGATEFDDQQAEHPWTIGWQPDYQAEGAIYGKYVANNLPGAKVGIIYQNDAYGIDYVEGFTAGLGSHKTQIVTKQGFDVTAPSLAQQVVALKAANPDVVCIFGTPTPTIKTYATMKALGFKPNTIILNSVSATDTIMKLAIGNSSTDEVNGSISVGYTLDPQNPDYNKLPGMKLYRAVMKQYAKGADASNGLYLYGVAKAYDTVQLIKSLGKNPTRAALQKAWSKMNWTNPFLLPGVKVKTSATDPYPIQQMQLIKFSNGLWRPVGDLINGRGK